MATTHVFIVDENTFKYHLQYLFAGTGSVDNDVDFNNSSTSAFHHSTERNLVRMFADFNRIRKDDFIIFYLLANKLRDGKFFGVFKVAGLPFIDDAGSFLYSELNKKLTFRCPIKAFDVYAEGITEWEALDEIKGITAPYQMMWSLIYRKLRAHRGNTMITIYESKRLIDLIRKKNMEKTLESKTGFSFDGEKIVPAATLAYKGIKNNPNILPRLLEKYKNEKAFEEHLQSYLAQRIDLKPDIKNIIIGNGEMEWLGNEVSCGVGMQRIDMLLSVSDNNEKKKYIIPIELKDEPFYEGIAVYQMQRYVDWLKQYYIPNGCDEIIQPVVITKPCENPDDAEKAGQELDKFNKKNSDLLPIKWVKFKLNDAETDFEFFE